MSRYAIAVGSNRRGRHGSPAAEVHAALAALGGIASPVIVTRPLGPSQRRYANAVALIERVSRPDATLRELKSIERDFGRRPGRRWGERVLDLDIILWSGGTWASQGLTIPHIGFRTRDFVLAPLMRVAPRWRDPVTGLTVRQLRHRLTARRAMP